MSRTAAGTCRMWTEPVHVRSWAGLVTAAKRAPLMGASKDVPGVAVSARNLVTALSANVFSPFGAAPTTRSRRIGAAPARGEGGGRGVQLRGVELNLVVGSRGGGNRQVHCRPEVMGSSPKDADMLQRSSASSRLHPIRMHLNRSGPIVDASAVAHRAVAAYHYVRDPRSARGRCGRETPPTPFGAPRADPGTHSPL